jgi:ATP-dependent DNA helicase RecG
MFRAVFLLLEGSKHSFDAVRQCSRSFRRVSAFGPDGKGGIGIAEHLKTWVPVTKWLAFSSGKRQNCLLHGLLPEMIRTPCRGSPKGSDMTLTLEDLASLREGWDVELKKAGGQDGRGAVPASLWETYSALANTQGGIIILGIEERAGGGLHVRGLADPDRVERDLWNGLFDRKKVSVNLLDRESVRRDEVDGSVVLVLHVPRASRRQRPVFLNNNPLTGTYVRGHEGDRRCSPEEVRRMLADADESCSRDSRVLPGYTLEDLDPASLSAYRQLFRLSSANHAFLAEDDLGLLRKLGVWKRDRETGEEGPTLAAVLMLGREEAIREHLPHVHLDYRELPADEGGGAAAVRWLDRVTLDGTWSGNVLGFYQRVMPKLVAGLKVPFHLEPDLLRRDETHVHEALREALANSLVHADYTASSGIRIVRKPDGYEFLNPGTLLLPIEQIRAGGTSECRNPLLQHMFRLAGIGEKAGSGFPTILRAWREQHWRAPLLEDDVDRCETRLRLGVTSLFPEATLDALRVRFGDRFRRLTEDARLALATAWTEGRVTNRRLRELSSRHARDLTLLLSTLVEGGFLVPHAERRARWYTVARLPGSEPSSVQSSVQSRGESSVQSGPSSVQSSVLSERSSVQSSVQSHGESSVQSGPSSVQSTEATEGGLPARVAGRRWARREDVRQAVLLVCRDEFVPLPELAAALNRSPQALRIHHLAEMVESGQLELRHPGKPNHPSQAYRAADPG